MIQQAAANRRMVQPQVHNLNPVDGHTSDDAVSNDPRASLGHARVQNEFAHIVEKPRSVIDGRIGLSVSPVAKPIHRSSDHERMSPESAQFTRGRRKCVQRTENVTGKTSDRRAKNGMLPNTRHDSITVILGQACPSSKGRRSRCGRAHDSALQ